MPNPPPIFPIALTVEQAAAALGVSVATVRGWIRRRHLPAAKVGKRLLIRTADISAVLEPNSPAAPPRDGGEAA